MLSGTILKVQEKLKELAQANERSSGLSADIKAAKEILEATSEYKTLEAFRVEASAVGQTITTLREEINQLTLEAYDQTGDKKPAPGVGIRVTKSLVYDETQAREYCVTNLVEALKLDKRIFEKYANGVSEVKPLEFVTIKETPSATIATDLSEYLPQIPFGNAENPQNFAPGAIIEQIV